jgi:hypothetical protein
MFLEGEKKEKEENKGRKRREEREEKKREREERREERSVKNSGVSPSFWQPGTLPRWQPEFVVVGDFIGDFIGILRHQHGYFPRFSSSGTR